MKVYHGSKVEVSKPVIMVNGFYKDFGYGFYCTIIEDQAKKWAKTKSRNNPTVSIYDYNQNNQLCIKTFDKVDEEWLDFIAACRSGQTHSYDIVEGPMADDTIWDYVNDYLSGRISKEIFLEFAKFKHPTHQIAFCTDKALECLVFERSYLV